MNYASRYSHRRAHQWGEAGADVPRNVARCSVGKTRSMLPAKRPARLLCLGKYSTRSIPHVLLLASAFLSSGQITNARTLFLSHFDGDTVTADYAAGSTRAAPVPGQPVARTTADDEGRWGRGLDLRRQEGGRCAYDALRNLDIRRGTVDFWYCIDAHEPGMYPPFFGWYNPPGTYENGALSVYTQDALMTLDVQPPSSPVQAGFQVDQGKWHHLEINWDCAGGDGASTYNVYIDGKLVLTKTNAKALKAAGGRLHLGIWGYAYGHFLHGRIDEFRITDQIEHLTSFAPPEAPYPTPGTIASIRRDLTTAQRRLGELRQTLRHLDGVPGIKAIELQRTNDRYRQLTGKLGLVNVTAADRAATQTVLSGVSDSIQDLLREVMDIAGTRYSMIPAVHNEVLVQLAYLRDETEGLERAVVYSDRLNTAATVAAIERSRAAAVAADELLATASRDFFTLFVDASGARTNPVNAMRMFTASKHKARIMDEMLRSVSTASDRVEEARGGLRVALRQLRTSPQFKAVFPHYRPFVPPSPGPVAVESNGRLKRIIFGGGHGRTDTLSTLDFDTLQENGVDVVWSEPDRFQATPFPAAVAQWEKYKIPLSDKILSYAIGDGMYRPPWFADVHGEKPEYYFAPNYTGSGGFDYRHPVPRQLILKYLEESARLNSQQPYTFIYKGPWEAHPYRGTSVDVPGKRTVAFQEHGFSAVAIKAFRDYLQKKHGTIEALNKAWKSDYKSFHAIQPPKPLVRAFVVTKDARGQDVYTTFLPNKRLPGAATTALTYEFERCRKDLYADYLADCYAAIRRGDPRHPLASSTSGGIMGEILINSLDDLQMPARCVDMWGKHPSGGYGWDDSPYMYGLNRYFNKTLVSLEYYGWAQEVIGDNFYGTFQVAKGATTENIVNAGRRDVWHELSWDRRMLLFYWTQKLVRMDDGFQESHSPLLRPWSGFIPAVKRRVMRLNEILVDVPIVPPRIAVLHPGASIINAYPTNACARITRDLFDRLLSKQYHFGVVPETFLLEGRDQLENYDVLILPYAQYFVDGFDKQLDAWIRNGGTLISAGPYGLYNQYGVPLQSGARQVFKDLDFTYPPPEQYHLSWAWQATRAGKPIAERLLVAQHGRGTVLMTLDGRAFSRHGGATEAHVGTEIGAQATGKETPKKTLTAADDRARPLRLGADEDLPQAVKTFYKTLKKATRRDAWVRSGNVEMVVRGKGSNTPRYLSMLNWDFTQSLATEALVHGAYRQVTDLTVEDGFPVPATVNNGITRIPVRLGPGEGILLQLQR